jgi:predicted RND superfamily exporter protein
VYAFFSPLLPDRLYERIARPIFWLVIVSVPFLLYGVYGALQGGHNDVRQWLPDGFQETREYDEFLRQFGSEEMAVASWPGCTLDDPRLQRFAAELRTSSEFKRVLTSTEAVAELTREPMNVPRDEAEQRLRELLIGRDGRTAATIVWVNEAGAADRRAALDVVRDAAERAGVPRDELYVAGPTADSVALQSESQKSRYLLAAISVVVAISLAWRSLKNIRLAVMVFSTALLCAGINVATVYASGETLNLLMGMMPTLTYLLGLSGSVHLVNYYREEVRERGVDGAPLRAVKAAWLPCFLSAATTAVGLGSLGTSDVIPVRMFGYYAAIGVLTTLPVLYLFLPSLLHLWPIVERSGADADRENRRSGAMARLVNWIIARRAWVVGGCTLVMLAGAVGVSQLNTSVKLLNLFSPRSQIIHDYAWLEKHLGPMVPIEIVLNFDASNKSTMFERLELVRQIEAKLNALDKVGGTMSAATFAPSLPTRGGASHTTRRALLARRLEQHRDYFLSTRYLTSSDAGERWRISARVEALNSLDYGHFVNALRAEVEPVLRAWPGNADGRVDAVYTGIVPLVYKAQRTLLDDLAMSFISAFFLIGLMMMGLLRSVRAGLVSMIPNVFPAIVLFGLMGLSGMLCDIGSMMTAGAAMGIAVDDTIHFLTWFRRSFKPGMARDVAIHRAHAHSATAMIQSTVICGMGILVFAFSAFVPTSRFAWLMAAMLGVGLIGDLILLPAILAGPLGRFFIPRSGGEAAVPANNEWTETNLAPAGCEFVAVANFVKNS